MNFKKILGGCNSKYKRNEGKKKRKEKKGGDLSVSMLLLKNFFVAISETVSPLVFLLVNIAQSL